MPYHLQASDLFLSCSCNDSTELEQLYWLPKLIFCLYKLLFYCISLLHRTCFNICCASPAFNFAPLPAAGLVFQPLAMARAPSSKPARLRWGSAACLSACKYVLSSLLSLGKGYKLHRFHTLKCKQARGGLQPSSKPALTLRNKLLLRFNYQSPFQGRNPSPELGNYIPSLTFPQTTFCELRI